MRYAATTNNTLRAGKIPQRPTEGQTGRPAEDQKTRARALSDQLRDNAATYERAVKCNKRAIAKLLREKMDRQREELREVVRGHKV